MSNILHSSVTLDNSTYFSQSGANFFLKNKLDESRFETLPGGNYAIKHSIGVGYFLEKISDFPEHKRLYGNTSALAKRILTSFRAKTGNLGVTLFGEKGSGKTLLGRETSRLAAKEGVPTLFITAAYTGEAFFQFLYKIQQECIIFIDEYEKLYEPKEQEDMLTVLDGVFQSKKLFILTCNDRYKLDTHLTNRPGRIHYLIEFNGLSPEFIKEFCEDRLENKDQIDEVLTVCSLFATVNFDMLQTLVWEMNLYKENASKAIQLLNAKPEGDTNLVYNAEVFLANTGKTYGRSHIHPTSIKGTPLTSQRKLIALDAPIEDLSEEERAAFLTPFLKEVEQGHREKDEIPTIKHFSIMVDISDLTSVDPLKGSYTFTDKDGNKIIYTRYVDSKVTIQSLFDLL